MEVQVDLEDPVRQEGRHARTVAAPVVSEDPADRADPDSGLIGVAATDSLLHRQASQALRQK